MKPLILYMSHHGTTRKVVQQLKDKIRVDDVVDLGKGEAPPLNLFDTILIGGSIHIGQLQRKLKAYCEMHLEELLQKRVGLFLCFMNTKEGPKEFENAFPEPLRKHAFVKGLFGGELLEDQMNFMEKFLIRQLGATKGPMTTLYQKAIDQFVAIVNQGRLVDH